jgi:CheY-like chemotaxis protein
MRHFPALAEVFVSIGQRIAADLPFLRRYARALTGSQQTGDNLVQATLQTALADETIKRSLEGGRVALYRAFHVVLDSDDAKAERPDADMDAKEASAMTRLGAIADRKRQALLLTTVEEFSSAQAATIMNIDAQAVEDLAAAAIREIDDEQKTTVLIIEDEPMIQMQLEDLVVALGHEVCGTATTHSEAMDAVRERRPGLVLADIQLADGSSGLEAVEEILSLGALPVVFITAYPERLLTGDRIEPTYLVTKPFREQTVKASISQALFFG